MQQIGSRTSVRRRYLRLAAIAVPVVVAVFLFRSVIFSVAGIVFGGSAIAFLLEPLAKFYENQLSRSLSALFAILTVLAALTAAAWLLLPALVSELISLSSALPESIELVKGWLSDLSGWIQSHFPGLTVPSPKLDSARLPDLAAGTISFAGNVADTFYRLSLMVVLSYFLLTDRRQLMIRLELLIPQSARRTAVRMGNAVTREMKLYLRGQGMIAFAVGALAVAGLSVIGLPSALALGVIIGILNMIPYFGPVLGGIPAVLTALAIGWEKALMTVFVLWLVQQLDSTLISPRIMSGLTGFSPGVVLLAVFAGSSLGGIVGMLLALPLLMTFRTVFRVFVQRHENV